MRCLACNKILSDYETSRGIIMDNGVKKYLDMCVKCDDTPSEEVDENLELVTDEFDDLEEYPDIYDEVKL